MNPEELALWIEYETDRSIANRNALVEYYLPFLREIAARKARSVRRTPTSECEDMENDAVPALIQCVERFDRSRGFRFQTYAAGRVNGAILDQLRNNDWVPRLERRHASMHPIEIAAMFPMSVKHEESLRDPRSRQDFEDDFWRIACKSLNKPERLAVLMYFRLHKTMKEIGKSIGLSESRVSQLMSSVKKRLAATVGSRLEEEGRAA